MELQTDRTYLRKIELTDVDAIYENWASDDEVSKYLTWPTHKDKKTTEMIVKSWLKDYEQEDTIRYGIVLKDNNELIGTIDVVRLENNIPEIGYTLSRKYWNKGLMTEVLKLFTTYLFSLGYEKITVKALKDNIGSNRVILKNEFTFENETEKILSSFKPYLVKINNYHLKNNKDKKL